MKDFGSPRSAPLPGASSATSSELLAPLSDHQASVEAQRCLYCYDAPCMHACPTHIDVPTFIRKISTGNVRGAGRTILESNFLGGTCARVCPVEELCEGACVLGPQHQAIHIGRLQRYAVDEVQRRGLPVFKPAPSSGQRVAVVGSGPAGISAAAELAKLGHAVTVFEKRELAGGLSTYGIISLREPVEVAQREVRALQQLGVEVRTGQQVSSKADLETLLAHHDAVFLGVGLGAVPALGIPGEAYLLDGLRFIEQAKLRPHSLPVLRQVLVVGAGNTAIDAATMARRAGASVTVLYRRSQREMTAYRHEYEFALREGIQFMFQVQPLSAVVRGGLLTGLRCAEVALGEPDASGRAHPQVVLGSELTLAADTVIKAIGQEKPALAQELGLALERGYVQVNGELQTSWPRVWAGGDAVRVRGSASTVMAVQDGKLAARSIHAALSQGEARRG